MTDSSTRTRSGKRDRLVTAAVEVVYKQGVEATTLADIASAAGIPVGNVYYYFKTKADIITAVIDAHARDIRATLAQIEASHPAPQDRLRALFGVLAGQAELVARYGCPQGSLCQELNKLGPQSPDASSLLRLSIDWAERQFAAMGRDDARDLAVQMLAAYQGTALLAATLRDPSLMERESRRMAAWIDSL